MPSSLEMMNYFSRVFNIKFYTYEMCKNKIEKYTKDKTCIDQDIYNAIFNGSVYDDVKQEEIYFIKSKNFKSVQYFLSVNNIISYDYSIIEKLILEYVCISGTPDTFKKCAKILKLKKEDILKMNIIDFSIINNNSELLKYFSEEIGEEKYNIKSYIEENNLNYYSKNFIIDHCKVKKYLLI